jgi:hypothetical protein
MAALVCERLKCSETYYDKSAKSTGHRTLLQQMF